MYRTNSLSTLALAAVFSLALLLPPPAYATGNWAKTKEGCDVWNFEADPEETFTFSWSGSCQHNRIHGNGTLTTVNTFEEHAGEPITVTTIYKGDMKEGRAHGQGTLTEDGEKRYEGGFHEGKFWGKGKHNLFNGERYEGEFALGTYNGYGIYYYTNGNRYEGNYVDSISQGVGTFFFADGDRYEGDFVDYKREGKGTFFLRNGDRYEGEWKADLALKGTYYFAAGGSLDTYQLPDGSWKQ